jgi:hypothetical protein
MNEVSCNASSRRKTYVAAPTATFEFVISKRQKARLLSICQTSFRFSLLGTLREEQTDLCFPSHYFSSWFRFRTTPNQSPSYAVS